MSFLIATSIIGTIAFALGIAWAVGMKWRHDRRPDPIENFEGDYK